MAVQHNTGTGRRKSAVARVFLKAGKGNIVVNGKPVDEFFSRETGRMIVRQPLVVIDKLNAGVQKALSEKELRERMIARGADPAPGTPEQLAAYHRQELAKWTKLIKATGIKVSGV